MTENNALIINMKKIFTAKGSAALRRAKCDLALISKNNANLAQALQYFSNVTLHGSMPVFPSLVTLSCEAVGGDANKAIPFGEAVILIASAADLHDDIIDHSLIKGPKQTVFGKFGVNETILAGDVLLTQGLTLLHKACEFLPKEQSDTIRHLAANTILDLCIAESLEGQLSKNGLNITPKEFNQLVNLKAVFPDFAMKIGAIIGNGSSQEVETLGGFGRFFGIISTIADEFSDLLNPDELTNRLKNECPPIPIIYALQDIQIKNELLPLLNLDILDEKTHEKVSDLVLGSSEIKLAINEWRTLAEKQIIKLEKEKIKNLGDLSKILLAPLEFIVYCSS